MFLNYSSVWERTLPALWYMRLALHNLNEAHVHIQGRTDLLNMFAVYILLSHYLLSTCLVPHEAKEVTVLPLENFSVKTYA